VATLWFLRADKTGRRGVARYLREAADYATVAGEAVPAEWARLDLDCHTNADLCAGLAQSTDAYSLAGDGTVLRNGQPVAIAPPAPDSMLAIPPKDDASGRIEWCLKRMQRGRV
jgi:hypothetical protein